MKNLIVFGIQGSGKGTQANLLVKKHGGKILGTGDIFRALATKDTPLAKEVKELIDQGVLISDELVAQLVAEEYALLRKTTDLIIFDGFPRTIAQVDAFEQLIADHQGTYHAIYLSLTKEESLGRIEKRFVLEGRADDGEVAVLERRFENFFAATMPVITFFEEKGTLSRVDGSRSIEEVSTEIDTVLTPFLGV